MVFRLISGLFLLAATIALISEATRAQLGVPGAPFTPIITQLSQSAPGTYAGLQKGAQAIHPWVWDPLLRVTILALPAWITLAAIGVLFGWLGRRRRTVNVYTN